MLSAWLIHIFLVDIYDTIYVTKVLPDASHVYVYASTRHSRIVRDNRDSAILISTQIIF
jgi:hypothetical protein